MGADYLLPGSVLALKFIFKLFVGQAPRLVDWLKALITFPVDVTFLGFSFGAATLAHAGQAAPGSKAVIAFALIGVVCAAATTLLSRRAEHDLDRENYLLAVCLSAFGYLVAGTVVYLSLVIGIAS